jgi:hypothetical protein
LATGYIEKYKILRIPAIVLQSAGTYCINKYGNFRKKKIPSNSGDVRAFFFTKNICKRHTGFKFFCRQVEKIKKAVIDDRKTPHMNNLDSKVTNFGNFFLTSMY